MNNQNEESTDLKIAESQLAANSFGNKEAFEHIQRVAKVFSQSDLVPVKYKDKIGNCVIALEMAHRMGINPLMVMQNLDVIMGRPCWSSQFLIASLNACGKFSPLRYEEDKEDGGRTRAYATDKLSGEVVYGVWVSMKMAEAEGWTNKSGSKWKTMPELMRRYRAASFFTKQYAPEISMGFQTVDEVQDITYTEVKEPQKVDKEAERVTLMIEDATDLAQLAKLEEHITTPEQKDLFNQKAETIKKKGNGK